MPKYIDLSDAIAQILADTKRTVMRNHRNRLERERDHAKELKRPVVDVDSEMAALEREQDTVINYEQAAAERESRFFQRRAELEGVTLDAEKLAAESVNLAHFSYAFFYGSLLNRTRRAT